MKSDRLLKLAQERQNSRLNSYACVGDFHGGIFEWDCVSPWTKSGCNVDAKVMIVGQDWSSAETLSREPPDLESAKLGFSPRFPTNANLDVLLARHFRLRREQCYLTNVFPFIKHGNASSSIPMKDMVACAKRYALQEIGIVSPSLVICLGVATFRALRRANGLKGSPSLVEAIASPFQIKPSMVHCVAHTGVLGMNNRGRAQVDEDWAKLATMTAC